MLFVNFAALSRRFPARLSAMITDRKGNIHQEANKNEYIADLLRAI